MTREPKNKAQREAYVSAMTPIAARERRISAASSVGMGQALKISAMDDFPSTSQRTKPAR